MGEDGSDASGHFSPVTESVREARRFVAGVIDSWGAIDNESVILLTSELATNAVIHAKTAYTVSVRLLSGRVRVEVVDGSPAIARRRHYSTSSGTGRGLALVEELSSAWGVEDSDEGKLVWFEVTSDAVPSTAEAR